MAKVTIKLTHCKWRDGRPRFSPGPKLRVLGFDGEDLKKDDGSWMNLVEAQAWVEAKQKEIDQARQRKHETRKIGRRSPATSGRPVAIYTVGDLFEDYWRTPRLRGQDIVDGKRRQKALSPATIRDYRGKARALEQYDVELWHSAVTALDTPILYGLYEELWRDKGLSMARGILAVLSAAISWGVKRGKVKLAGNPALGLGMQTPEPRVRAGEPDEMRALVAAADTSGRPEIGDAIMLALWTGQRQSDRLALVDAGLVDGRRIFKQSKTGAIVAIKEAPELEARLSAARDRRQRLFGNVEPLADAPVILDEKQKRPFNGDHYRHLYADIRDAAAVGCPSLEDFQERDLRDTAVTWLARAGATVPEICAVTGHSTASATAILKHYLARHPELADSAIAKMVTWYEGKSA